jgi:hypothetical protein
MTLELASIGSPSVSVHGAHTLELIAELYQTGRWIVGTPLTLRLSSAPGSSQPTIYGDRTPENRAVFRLDGVLRSTGRLASPQAREEHGVCCSDCASRSTQAAVAAFWRTTSPVDADWINVSHARQILKHPK